MNPHTGNHGYHLVHTLRRPPVRPGRHALHAAASRIGIPCIRGAGDHRAFDSSGLVQWAYKQAGVAVPRTTYEQLRHGTAVDESDLQPGDVVLFYGGGHAGIYAGNDTVVHAPAPGRPVTRVAMNSMSFHAARRY
ncbi:C40 family peptidase [Rhodococcus opacus]|uniref:NlpC/P60 family protein n=1 Tax=Rhodococcus opacus TaxID=37919 RepID=A0AAX3YKU6_RHOOP|nr:MULTISPECIES: NlpC/P60 family protein [Rhodococcus]ELB87421.1 NlpC/P60 family protein [Rhodococcus wratislaviensis IFP 2016]NHU45110.1 peptidoglycan endopeptidase [Rhodococcus sp. A14]MBA8958793.1 cell wall-associated NlpC family hydrolase [Rhodococcus opacus]MBP2204358.1 cell wall-associated NlpC family hydrolase [Rhodococcus opacus]MCZ4585131.1 NlpC/P60 family protein [Rhodococcus opacus]